MDSSKLRILLTLAGLGTVLMNFALAFVPGLYKFFIIFNNVQKSSDTITFFWTLILVMAFMCTALRFIFIGLTDDGYVPLLHRTALRLSSAVALGWTCAWICLLRYPDAGWQSWLPLVALNFASAIYLAQEIFGSRSTSTSKSG